MSDMDIGFAIYTIFCIIVGAFGIYCASKCHRH